MSQAEVMVLFIVASPLIIFLLAFWAWVRNDRPKVVAHFEQLAADMEKFK